jgi:hypothetical protein
MRLGSPAEWELRARLDREIAAGEHLRIVLGLDSETCLLLFGEYTAPAGIAGDWSFGSEDSLGFRLGRLLPDGERVCYTRAGVIESLKRLGNARPIKR